MTLTSSKAAQPGTSCIPDRKTYLTPNNTNSEPRVLFATTIAATVRAFLLPLARHFQERGWRVDAIANGIGKDQVCRPAFERVWEAEWSRNPLRPQNFMMAERIRNLTIEHGYDIVHVHTPVAAFVTRLGLDSLRHEQRLQVLYTAHGFHFHPMGGSIRNNLFELLERKAANWTDFLIVLNRDDLRAAKEKKLIGLDRLRFMPGIGVDRSRYSNSSVPQSELDRLYAELGISAATPVLLMVAEFTERKRHADAIRAFSKAVQPPAHLMLAGSGPLFEPMKRLAAELGAADRIHFLGNRNDVPVLMKASRTLIVPSSQEGLPRCILEAMSMGVPVIGSRIRGTTELLERNAGLLVDVGDIDQLTQAMQLVLDDGAAAAAMGEAGLQQSEAYDLLHILRMHEELYEEALELRRSPATNCSHPSVA
jgi:glycosyltransferase involved in cell wall biosynthesis